MRETTAVQIKPWPALLGGACLLAGCPDSFSVNENTPPLLPQEPEPTPIPTPWPVGHLKVEPATLDFGPVPVGCRVFRDVTIRNQGLEDVEVFAIAMAQGTTAELAVDNQHVVLAPFDQIVAQVRYAPANPGGDATTLLIQSDAPDQSLIDVPVAGRDSPGGEGYDTFRQGPAAPADFLWILDTSGSMNDNIELVVANFENFMYGLTEQGVDYQMGMITTDMYDEGNLKGSYGEEGLPFITTAMGQAGVDAFKSTMIAESASSRGDERGLDSMAAALSPSKLSGVHAGFIRPNATLVISAFSDEDDHSSASVSVYASQLAAVKEDPSQILFNSVVALPSSCPSPEQCSSSCADEAGFRYIEMSQQHFDGYVDEVCSDSYGQMMSTLATYGVELQSIFPLSQPADPAYPITVTVDGEAAEESELTGWTYDEALAAIVFSARAVPPAAAELVVTYTLRNPCQGEE